MRFNVMNINFINFKDIVDMTSNTQELSTNIPSTTSYTSSVILCLNNMHDRNK